MDELSDEDYKEIINRLVKLSKDDKVNGIDISAINEVKKEISGSNIDQALKRPSNYWRLDPRAQWDIDKELGILDWDPTPEEIAEYKRRKNIPQDVRVTSIQKVKKG